MSPGGLVLITRTRPAAADLVDRVRTLGLEPFECAPFQLSGPADERSVAGELEAALPADRVILTSQEAVRQAVNLVGADRFSRSLVIVPGHGTALVARRVGLDNVIFPERHGTSEAMLTMPELRDVEGLDVLILAAAGGRGLIGEVLSRRGASVERIHVYRRVPCSLPPDLPQRIRDSRDLATLGASLEAVTGLIDGLGSDRTALKRLRAAPLIVPSRRVADQAAELGCRRCIVAAGAGDEAMLAELSRLT